MWAESEGDVAVGGSRDIEGVGFGELRGVAVGRREHHQDRVALLDGFPAQPRIDRRDALIAVEGAGEAEEFFDGGVHQLRVAPQLFLLFRMTCQFEQGVGEQARGGFVSAEENSDSGSENFVFGQGVAFAAGVNHEGKDIVTRGCSARFDSDSQIGAEIEEGLLGLQTDFERRGGRLHERHDAGGPFRKEGDVAEGHAEELSDHVNGQRMSEIANNVELTGGDDLREQIVDEDLDEIPIAADRRGTEDFVEQASDPGVAGRIDIDEPVRVVIDQRLELGELGRIEITLK